MKKHQAASNPKQKSERLPAREISPDTGRVESKGRLMRITLGLFLMYSLSTYAVEMTGRVFAIRVPNVSKLVKAQRGADGAIHLLFDAEDIPYYLRSADGGASFSAPIPVVDVATRKPGLKFSGWDIAVGKDGRVHVAMG